MAQLAGDPATSDLQLEPPFSSALSVPKRLFWDVDKKGVFPHFCPATVPPGAVQIIPNMDVPDGALTAGFQAAEASVAALRVLPAGDQP